MSRGISTQALPGRNRRRALVAALLVAATALFFVHWLPTVRQYYDYLQPVQTGAAIPQYDFFQYYAAGHNWRAGFDPYATLVGVPGAIAIPRSDRISGYIYPPAILPLLGQLARLSYDRARAVWLALCLAALLCPLVLGAVLAPGRRWVTIAAGLLLVAASDPVLFHIRQGQIDMIVAGLSVTAYLLYGRRRSWPTALLFAVAIAIKVTPLVLMLALVAYRRDWRLLAKTMLVGGLLVAATLVFVHAQYYVEYVSRVLPAASEGNPFFHNQSLLRTWSHLGEWAKYASLTGYAIVIAIAAAAGFSGTGGPAEVHVPAPRDSGAALRTRDIQVLGLAVIGLLLFSPLAWRMAFVWAVVPMALVLAAVPWRGRAWQYALVATGTALMCLPLWDLPVLDSLETIGAGLAGIGLLTAILGTTVDPPPLSRWRPARSRRAAGL